MNPNVFGDEELTQEEILAITDFVTADELHASLSINQ